MRRLFFTTLSSAQLKEIKNRLIKHIDDKDFKFDLKDELEELDEEIEHAIVNEIVDNFVKENKIQKKDTRGSYRRLTPDESIKLLDMFKNEIKQYSFSGEIVEKKIKKIQSDIIEDIIEELEENIVKEISKEENKVFKCEYVLKSGKHKGEKCGKNNCKRHKIKI